MMIAILLSIIMISQDQAADKCYDFNCQKCESTEINTCVQCKEGFYLIDGSCPCYDPNCLDCTSSHFRRCNKCKDSFILDNGVCTCDISNCLSCSSLDCDQCQHGFFLVEGKCLKHSSYIQICNDPNCKKCFNNNLGSCSDCNEGYQLIAGQCQLINECARNEEGICKKCLNDYVLIDNYCYEKCSGLDCSSKKLLSGQCSENTCYDCDDDGKLTENYACVINEGYCFDTNCEQCISNKEGRCERCKVGYKRTEGRCKKCSQEHCSNCENSNDGSCTQCLKDYALIDGKCVLSLSKQIQVALLPKLVPTQCDIFKCVECDNNSNCIKCTDGFILNNNKCEMPCHINNCQSCSEDKCIECNLGFKLDNNECHKCADENCATCSSLEKQSCDKCTKVFSVFNRLCASSVCNELDNCELCFDRNECLKCKSSCTLANGKCKCFNLSIILISTGAIFGVFVVILISFVVYTKKEGGFTRFANMLRNRNNIPTIIVLQSESARTPVSHTPTNTEGIQILYEKEFETNYLTTEENQYPMCTYCTCKIAKYVADCGCNLCFEHSQGILDSEYTEEVKKCLVCSKIIHKIDLKKNNCEICFEMTCKLAKFSCRCALSVCRNCFIKCKFASDQCPSCRRNINWD